MPKLLASNLASHRHLVLESLLDALDHLLDERDYERITMADIANRAGVARNTVYNYANDKAALLLAAVRRSTTGIDEQVNALVQAAEMSASERLRSVIGFLLTSFTRGTHRVFVLQAQVGSLEVEDQAIATASIDAVQSSISRVLSEGARAGEFRTPSNTELDLAFISGIMAAAVRQIALAEDEHSAIVDEATGFILRAVRA
ncbi:TetR/AcrR family transcriptional regulator [Cryobacterium sp. AP23]